MRLAASSSEIRLNASIASCPSVSPPIAIPCGRTPVTMIWPRRKLPSAVSAVSVPCASAVPGRQASAQTAPSRRAFMKRVPFVFEISCAFRRRTPYMEKDGNLYSFKYSPVRKARSDGPASALPCAGCCCDTAADIVFVTRVLSNDARRAAGGTGTMDGGRAAGCRRQCGCARDSANSDRRGERPHAWKDGGGAICASA